MYSMKITVKIFSLLLHSIVQVLQDFFLCVISVPCCWLQHNEPRDRKCLHETAGPGSDQESRQSEDTAEGTMSQEPVH